MAVLWERGPSTVAEVREELSDELSPPVRFKLTGHRPAA